MSRGAHRHTRRLCGRPLQQGRRCEDRVPDAEHHVRPVAGEAGARLGRDAQRAGVDGWSYRGPRPLPLPLFPPLPFSGATSSLVSPPLLSPPSSAQHATVLRPQAERGAGSDRASQQLMGSSQPGRRSQRPDFGWLLVLTSKLSRPAGLDECPLRRLHTIPSVLVFGRSARAAPPVKAKLTVFSWYGRTSPRSRRSPSSRRTACGRRSPWSRPSPLTCRSPSQPIGPP